ncbi:aminotransferase class I/II-fold pyridoxal phosphate-dependent enzyme [bacterium]|nr:aminotransferase class I/II-fold pyridoxal phosphate-dependent enzyme [bacterium]
MLNYPNNPTGATADLSFFKKVVDLAKKHDLIVARDNAYSEIGDDRPFGQTQDMFSWNVGADALIGPFGKRALPIEWPKRRSRPRDLL